jgi:methyl-accepting chemotaxis protein
MLNRLGVKARLTLAFVAISGLFLAILLIAAEGISRLAQDVQTINERTLPNALLADEMNLSRSDVQQFLTDVSATHDPDGFEESEKAARRFLQGVEKFKQLYREEGDAESLREIEAHRIEVQ